MIDITVPIKTVSEANKGGEHWTKKSKRHQAQKKAVISHLLTLTIPKRASLIPPLHITLIRIAPRKLDIGDNLPMAFKFIKDAIAAFILPGLATGRADDSSDLHWLYLQQKGAVKEYAVRIVIIPYIDEKCAKTCRID